MVSVFNMHSDGAGCKHSGDVPVVKFSVMQLAVNKCMYTHVKKGSHAKTCNLHMLY